MAVWMLYKQRTEDRFDAISKAMRQSRYIVGGYCESIQTNGNVYDAVTVNDADSPVNIKTIECRPILLLCIWAERQSYVAPC